MNLKKLGIIIQREYLNKVKKKSFLLTTFGVPILFAGIYAVMLFVMLKAEGDSKRIAVIDNSGIVMEKLEDTKLITFKQLSETDPEAVKNRLAEYDADILLYISPLDSATKSVTATTYADKPMGMETAEVIERRINDAVESYRIDSYDIPGLEQIMEDVQFNIHLTSYTVDEEGKETISQSEVYMIVSMVLAMALYMFIALFSGMVLREVHGTHVRQDHRRRPCGPDAVPAVDRTHGADHRHRGRYHRHGQDHGHFEPEPGGDDAGDDVHE